MSYFLQAEPIDRVFIQIGPVPIYWYAVLILSGAALAFYLAVREGKRIGIEQSFLEDLVLVGLPLAIIGARLYYVAFEWENYAHNLLKIFALREGGLAIYGGVIAALIWGYYLSEKRNVDFLRVIDVAAVGFLIAQAIGRWGNFINQEAHGGPVTRGFLEGLFLPEFIINQMNINGTYYHPTFLYESLWNILGFIVMILLRRTKKLYVGDLGLVYLIWYGLGRAVIEGMRTDSLWIAGFRVSQVLSVIMVIGGITVMILRHVKKWAPKYYYELLEENNANPKAYL